MRGVAALLILFASIAAAQEFHPDFNELERTFEYDREAPLDVKEFNVEQRGDVRIIDMSYASPKGGRVPAYVVMPSRGKAPFPIILWGHWMMDGSPFKNRKEFLEEAVVLARSGAISLLIDNPLVRPGVMRDANPLSGQSERASQQMVIDFRRGIDVMIGKYRGDPTRIAYVGHSFEAHVGAILTAVEKRIKGSVLMAGGYSDEEFIFSSKDPEIVAWRQKYGDDRIREHIHQFAWDDPVYFVPHSAPAYVFLQFGNQDGELNGALAEHYLELFAQPNKVGFYDAGHALDAAARRDRAIFLRQILTLDPVDAIALDKIPPLK